MRVRLTLWSALLLFASPVRAQERGHNFQISAGLSPRTDAFSGSGALGVVRIGVVQRPEADRIFRARLDGEIVLGSSEGVDAQNGLRAASISYGVLVGPPSTTVAPYATGGVGLTFLSAQGGDDWPGFAFTGRAGAGVRGTVGGVELHAELAMVSALRSRGRIMLWPLTIGVSFSSRDAGASAPGDEKPDADAAPQQLTHRWLFFAPSDSSNAIVSGNGRKRCTGPLAISTVV